MYTFGKKGRRFWKEGAQTMGALIESMQKYRVTDNTQ